jgi:hypothetical protein
MMVLRIAFSGFVLLSINWLSLVAANVLHRFFLKDLDSTIIGLLIVIVLSISGFWAYSMLLSQLSFHQLLLRNLRELVLAYCAAPLLNPLFVVVLGLVTGAGLGELKELFGVSLYQFLINILPVLIVREKVYNKYWQCPER